jgi:NADH-quinone oxidoreductase subunit G
MLILGHDMLTRSDGEQILNLAKKIAEKFNMIQDSWNGFNFLPKSTGLLNGLWTGFVGNSNVAEILEKTEKNEIKMMILHSVDDDIDFEKIKNCFVIYIGSHGDKGAHHADIILPAAAYSEKNAIYINLEARPQSTMQAAFSPGESREDCSIILELAKKFGFDLGFKNLEEIRESLAKKHVIFTNLDTAFKNHWIKSHEVAGDLSSENLSVKNFDFYLTNPIARASRTLNKCSSALN